MALQNSTQGSIGKNMISERNPIQHLQTKLWDCPKTEAFTNMNNFCEHFNKDSQHLLAEGGQSNIYTFLSSNKQMKQLVIGKEYDISNRQKLESVWREYILIKNTKLLLYDDIYYDERQGTAMIISEPLNYTLRYYVETLNRNNNIAEKECKLIILDIMDKLYTTHKCGFIHNDLTPDNIMYKNGDYRNANNHTQNGWKIIDYGLMLALQDCDQSRYKYLGTRAWTSPETVPDSKHNQYSLGKDIWSLGLIILYILGGTQPYLLSGYEQSVLCKGDKDNYQQYFYYNKLLQVPFSNNKLKSNKFRKFMRKQFKKSYESVGSKKEMDFSAGELFLKKYLMNLYETNKISYDLCNLLSNYVLAFDPKKRLNLPQIYKHKWFNDVRNL